jgi:ABC-type multidrug transport system ATPase subunit
VSRREIDQIVNEVMDVTGLSERRDVAISQLSGGQRKRVSIAVELITKPSVIFLDEPTSGLDPATEEKIMKLFRQIAESGRTVILTTHAMENVKLFDKIVVLMRGKLVFYGKPEEALAHCDAESFKDLYDKLEAPIFDRLRTNGNANKDQIAEQVAEEWKRRFLQTEQYRVNVETPLRSVSARIIWRLVTAVDHPVESLFGSTGVRQIQPTHFIRAGSDHRAPDLPCRWNKSATRFYLFCPGTGFFVVRHVSGGARNNQRARSL